MDIDTQSLDHDELLGVEALEDIIDVENEMGFGEGEDWSHDDSSVGGYSKLAASRKRALNKTSTVHSRPHSSPLAIRAHRPRKPLSVVRHGVKFGVSSYSDGDEKPKVHKSAVRRPGVEDFVLSSDDVEKLKMSEEVSDDTNDLQGMFEHGEVATNPSLRSSQDEEGMCSFHMDSDPKEPDRSVRDMAQTSTDNGTERRIDGETVVKSDERRTAGQECAQKEGEKGMGKLGEKSAASSNRVRFSLDSETTEKIMGFANKKGGDGKEKGKCGRPQEWRYVRSTPSDSSGFGAPKGPVGVPAVRATSTQRSKEPAMTELFKDPSLGFDLERALEMRDDKKSARLAQERVERFEETMLKQQEIVANMRLSLAHEGTKDHAKLRQLVDALDRNIRKVTLSKARQVPQSYELKNRAEQINRLKAQCNLLETDRERLKKRLRHLLANADGKEREQVAASTTTKEREPDASLNERENLLELKVRDLEGALEEWESKFKKVEADFTMERALLEDSLSVCKLDWRNKQQRWVLKMKEREAELSHMKSCQDKLVDSLMSCRQCMDKLSQEAASNSGGYAASGANMTREGEDALHGCVKEMTPLNLALSIQRDMESLRQVLAESSLVLQHEQPEVLKQESQVLENKVAETISLMTQLKQEMKVKEDQIKKENEKYAQAVAQKVNYVESLEEQLANKERDIEGFMQELKDEVSLLNKELERERSERSRLSDMQGSMKYKLLKGLRKKEQKLEQEMVSIKENMDEMTASIAHKDDQIATLENEVNVKTAQIAHEKQKWNMAIKEVKQKAAKTILRFMHGKENGLLEHLRERRKDHKTGGEGRIASTCKIDDDDEEDSWMYQEGLSRSTREKLRTKRHQARAISREFDSPRENVYVGEDLRSSFELYKEDKAKHDYNAIAWKEDYCSQEFHTKGLKSARKNRTMEKRDVLKLLERRKGIGDNSFAIRQETVQVHDE